MSRHASFDQRLRQALDSPTLGAALDRFLTAFRERREAGFTGRDFAAGRQAVTTLKRDAIERLPELVKQFTEEAEKVGAVVHMARDAAHARRIIAGLAQERGVKRIVKGKSMATEEIELNPYLEAQGMEVVETDLGEWIIQLAHEHPSHLIAPAIHKRREDVAALFRQRLGENPGDDDIEEMVAIARRRLREAFISADMGITGANVAIAETGALVIVSNEGNQRLVSTLPPIHVAVLGIEKIVPTLEDAVAILQMLPRSATGQKISSYVSIIAGPSRTGDIELSLTTGVHGPKEVHIVLLDNGRWRMRADRDFSETLRCIRCAACSNVCPSYQVVGGHVFGHIYTGPIGLVLTPWHHGLENAAGPQSLCAGCNACETVCPAGIPLPQLIMEVRRQSAEEFGLAWSKQAALNAFADPPAFKRWMGLAALAQGPFQRGEAFVKPPFGPGFRSLPTVARTPLHGRLLDRRPAGGADARTLSPKPGVPVNGATGLTVSYFPGCITNWAYPDMGEAVVRAVEALGARVLYPPEQWCCGLPALNAGDHANGLKMAQQTVATLESAPGEVILTHSTSCAAAMLQDYGRLFRDLPEWAARAKSVQERLMDFAGFMERVARLPDGALAGRLPFDTVTYHDACQSHNALGLQAEPRRLLEGVLGLKVAEMRDAPACCGFGGTFSADHPEVSARILDRKLGNIEATGAVVVATDNPGCILQLRGGLDAKGSPIRVRHLAELLAQALEG